MSSSSQEKNEKRKIAKKNQKKQSESEISQTLAKFSITDLDRANTVVCRIP